MPASCEVDGCKLPVAHGEHFHERMRLWCEEHTPWSGHYEHCPDDCTKVLAKHGLQPPRDIEREIGDAFEISPYFYDQILCIWEARDGWRLCSKNGDRIDVWKVRDDGDGNYDFSDHGTIDP